MKSIEKKALFLYENAPPYYNIAGYNHHYFYSVNLKNKVCVGANIIRVHLLWFKLTMDLYGKTSCRASKFYRLLFPARRVHVEWYVVENDLFLFDFLIVFLYSYSHLPWLNRI